MFDSLASLQRRLSRLLLELLRCIAKPLRNVELARKLLNKDEMRLYTVHSKHSDAHQSTSNDGSFSFKSDK